ncbi:hypothetical protein MBAV_001805, partial [Candidatus Magnetobacterium bavaricum]
TPDRPMTQESIFKELSMCATNQPNITGGRLEVAVHYGFVHAGVPCVGRRGA